MKIEFHTLFEERFASILAYIGKDSIDASLRFEDKLFEHLDVLVQFPYKFRKSLYYHDEQIRDFVFKGYTIPYLIDEKSDVIVVLDIFKWTNRQKEDR